jgi:hypothetical protein
MVEQLAMRASIASNGSETVYTEYTKEKVLT